MVRFIIGIAQGKEEGIKDLHSTMVRFIMTVSARVNEMLKLFTFHYG